MKRWARRFGTFLAVVGSLVFVVYLLSTVQWQDLRSHINRRSLAALGAATLLYAMLVPLSAVAWQRILGGMGRREPFLPLLAILSVTQAGKYLPGNVGHHLGRIALSMARGIPPALLAASMAYEICLLLLADLFTAFAAGAVSAPGLGVLLQLSGNRHHLLVGAAVAIAVLGIAAVPLFSRYLPRLSIYLLRGKARPADIPTGLGLRTVTEVLLLYVLAMLFVGACLAVLSFGLFPELPVDFALLTAAFALAWVVGFVTPGAPAGLGVREALLLLMLGHSLGTANASVLIVALRIVTTLGDLVCFVAGITLLPRSGDGKIAAQTSASATEASPSSPHATKQD